jgi:hypothetical protein
VTNASQIGYVEVGVPFVGTPNPVPGVSNDVSITFADDNTPTSSGVTTTQAGSLIQTSGARRYVGSMTIGPTLSKVLSFPVTQYETSVFVYAGGAVISSQNTWVSVYNATEQASAGYIIPNSPVDGTLYNNNPFISRIDPSSGTLWNVLVGNYDPFDTIVVQVFTDTVPAISKIEPVEIRGVDTGGGSLPVTISGVDTAPYDSQQQVSPALNAPATIVLPATPNRKWLLTMITASIRSTAAVPGACQLTVQDGANFIFATLLGTVGVISTTDRLAEPSLSLIGSVNTAMTIILPAAGANVQGNLSIGAYLI